MWTWPSTGLSRRPDIEPERLHEAIRWSLFAGGKRIRPAICFRRRADIWSSSKIFHATAAAIEMIHTYSLIHDDLPAMDDDDLRAGKPTCHIQFGEATAILAGDVLQTLAFKAIAEDESLSPEIRIDLIADDRRCCRNTRRNGRRAAARSRRRRAKPGYRRDRTDTSIRRPGPLSLPRQRQER